MLDFAPFFPNMKLRCEILLLEGRVGPRWCSLLCNKNSLSHTLEHWDPAFPICLGLSGSNPTHRTRRGHRVPCAGGQGARGVRAGRADVARRCWSRSGRRSRRPCRAARTRRVPCPRAPSPWRDSHTPGRDHSVRPPVPHSSRPRSPGSAHSSRTRLARRSRALGRARARGSDPAGTGRTRGVVCPRRGARGSGSVTVAAGAAAADAAWPAPERTAAAPLLRLALGACKATAPAPRLLIGPACTAGRPSAGDQLRAALPARQTAGKSPEQLYHLRLNSGGDPTGSKRRLVRHSQML